MVNAYSLGLTRYTRNIAIADNNMRTQLQGCGTASAAMRIPQICCSSQAAGADSIRGRRTVPTVQLPAKKVYITQKSITRAAYRTVLRGVAPFMVTLEPFCTRAIHHSGSPQIAGERASDKDKAEFETSVHSPARQLVRNCSPGRAPAEQCHRKSRLRDLYSSCYKCSCRPVDVIQYR